MKFAEHLFEQSAPEWRKQYIQYQDIKVLLYNALKRAPSILNEDMDGVRAVYFAMFEDQFFFTCLKELQKINAFYHEKLTEAAQTLANLREDLTRSQLLAEKRRKFRKTSGLIFPTSVRTHKKEILVQFTAAGGGLPAAEDSKKRRSDAGRQLSDLKLAFSEFYLSLILLKNYQHLNHTGFRKILKKHDKLINTTSGARWLSEHVERSEFYTNRSVDALITTTEQVVTDKLEGGNRPRAMKLLRVVPPEDQQHSWTIFKFGLFLGALAVLFMVIVFIAIFEWIPVNWFLVFKLYRFPFLIILFTFMMGVNVYGWRSAGVNHVLIFELDPRNHLTEQHLMELAAFFGVFWALSVLTFIYYMASTTMAEVTAGSADEMAANEIWTISPYINPLTLLVTFFVAFLLNPTKTCAHQARFWFLSVLGRIMAAPFFEVKFADFWLADQLNSLVQILLDFQYVVCLYVTCPQDLVAAVDTGICHTRGKYIWVRSILACLPAWFRFMQCLRRYRDSREAFPHLANAAKYSTTFFVIIFATLHAVFEKGPEDENGPFFFLWITAAVTSSCYGLFWDIRMDWGLIESRRKEGSEVKKISFLRSEITYPFPWFYYMASVQDMILRFSWIPAYFCVYAGFIRRDNMVSLSAVLEIYRRFVWNFFRLENEHLNNCGKFRVVRDISLVHLTHPQYIYRKRQSWVLGLAPQK